MRTSIQETLRAAGSGAGTRVLRGRLWPVGLPLVLALLSSGVDALTANEVLGTRIAFSPSEGAWVGQKIGVEVDIFTDEILTGTPSVDVPSASGGILLQLPGTPPRFQESVDGRDAQATRYSFVLYPQRPGTIEIPAIRFRFPESSGLDGPVITGAAAVEARLPDGLAPGTALVSVENIEIREEWDPDPGSAETPLLQGAAFTRTIVRKAPDILGMGFPPIPVPAIEGVAVHVSDPAVRDTTNRGEITGERVDTIVYVFEKPGWHEIPSIGFSWFDLGSGEVGTRELAGHSFEVRAVPGYGDRAGGAAPPEDRAARRTLVLLALATVFCAVVLARFGSRWEAALAAGRRRRELGEAACFRRLQAAARSGDAAETWRALEAWVSARAGGAGAAPRIDRFIKLVDDREVGEAIGDLEATLFGPGSSAEDARSWSGGIRLGRALARARARGRRKSPFSVRRPTGGSGRGLAPLNPGSS